MFNGIIYNQGVINSIQKNKKNILLNIQTNLKLKRKDIGSSISCDGVCLTVISIKKRILSFYISKETLIRTNFKNLNVGSFVNLEKSLSFGDNISGHFVQGHVDTTAKILNLKKEDKTWIFNFQILRKDIRKDLVEKGSICINGVSLTISKISQKGFEVNVIPHTLSQTNLIKLTKGKYVNVEIDIFSKYIKKMNN